MDREKIIKEWFDKAEARFEAVGLDISSPFELDAKFMSPEYIGKVLSRVNWFVGVPVFVPLSEILVFAAALLEEWGEPVETQLGALVIGVGAGFIGTSKLVSHDYSNAAKAFNYKFCCTNNIDPELPADPVITHAVDFAVLQALADVLDKDDFDWGLFDESPTPFAFQVFSPQVSARRYQYKLEELLAKVKGQ